MPLDWDNVHLVVFDVERNPFYAASFVRSTATMWSLHIGQPIGLPRFGSRAGRGVAYRDLNGNGRREAIEPAIGGLAVRRGSETTVTDERGGFRFTNLQDGTPSLEVDTWRYWSNRFKTFLVQFEGDLVVSVGEKSDGASASAPTAAIPKKA